MAESSSFLHLSCCYGKCVLPHFFVEFQACSLHWWTELAHKDGELCLVRGAGRAGIHYAVSQFTYEDTKRC